MLEEVLSLLSLWASMNSWLTPTVLFLLLNLIIFTIAFTSSTSLKPPPPPPDLHRQPQHLQPQLSRSFSILQRLKSLNFYGEQPTDTATTADHHQQQQLPEFVPLSVDFDSTTPTKSVTETHVDTPVIEEQDHFEGPTMEEIYNRIIRNNSAQYGRQNSDTKPTSGEVPVRLPKKMKKSASDKSAFNHFEAEPEVSEVSSPPPSAVEAAVEEVDARADDFINKFKQQLIEDAKNGVCTTVQRNDCNS